MTRRTQRRGRTSTINNTRSERRTEAKLRRVGDGTGGGLISVAVTDAVQSLLDAFTASIEGQIGTLQQQVDQLIVQSKINNRHNEVVTDLEFDETDIEHEDIS